MTRAALLGLMLAASQDVPSPPMAAQKCFWIPTVVSAERITAGAQNEPPASPGELILKVGSKFQYTGPEGEIVAPVLKVRESTGEEHVMVGNLKTTAAGLDCLFWLTSAGNVVLGKKPETLASSTVSKCHSEVFYYHFVLPENPKPPLVLLFADAKPVSLSL
jgi:hypothetical protein